MNVAAFIKLAALKIAATTLAGSATGGKSRPPISPCSPGQKSNFQDFDVSSSPAASIL